jgi:hypothetical protein
VWSGAWQRIIFVNGLFGKITTKGWHHCGKGGIMRRRGVLSEPAVGGVPASEILEFHRQEAELGSDIAKSGCDGKSLIVQAFPGGADFGIVRFAEDLTISRVEMSLWAQKMAEDGPEYFVRAPGQYERWYREYDITAALTPEERAMMTGICSIFGTLTNTFAHLLTAPVTPRFQRTAAADSESPPAPSSLGTAGTGSEKNLPC